MLPPKDVKGRGEVLLFISDLDKLVYECYKFGIEYTR